MSKAFDKRYDTAEALATELIELVKDKAVRYTVPGHDDQGLAYVVGYMSSVLRRVAAESPAALEQLEHSVRAAR